MKDKDPKMRETCKSDQGLAGQPLFWKNNAKQQDKMQGKCVFAIA